MVNKTNKSAKSKIRWSNNHKLICCCCFIALALIIIGIITLCKAINEHNYADSYNIPGECTVIDVTYSQIILCNPDLKCSLNTLWVYYYTSDHIECKDKLNNEDNTKNIEITSSEQLDTQTLKSFSMGSIRICYTNKHCDAVYFTTSFNNHHADVIGSYIGVLVLLLIACCCICCAIQVLRVSKKQARIARISWFNSISINNKYIFCINNMLRKCYEEEFEQINL